jgi:hypothetical protein
MPASVPVAAATCSGQPGKLPPPFAATSATTPTKSSLSASPDFLQISFLKNVYFQKTKLPFFLLIEDFSYCFFI